MTTPPLPEPWREDADGEPRYTGETHESMARQAYKIADAMMEWRK